MTASPSRACLHAPFVKSKHISGEAPTLDQQFRTVSIQLQALGLVKVQYAEAIGGGMRLFWSLTPAGERLMMELRTVRKSLKKNRIVAATRSE